VYKDLADFVLAPFARDEREDVLALLPPLTATVETWMREGAEKAMNLHNRVTETDPGA
jgi:peptidyl-tRNA hydrolase